MAVEFIREQGTSEVAMYHQTEIGNTRRMLDKFGENIRYNKAFDYVAWDGKKWTINAEEDVKAYAERTILGMYDEASMLLEKAAVEKDAKVRKQLSREAEELNKWARTSETARMIASMVSLAKKHVKIETDAFDSHPFLFNFANGTMDLRTGELRGHRREDYLTVCVPHNYNPQADAPLFKQFFANIMLNRQDLMHYVQKALGLAMTADVSEQAWFLLLGTGANGKSTLLNTISHCLGEYADVMSDKTIAVASKGGGDGSAPSPDIARLKGKRLITVSETEDGARLATQLIKRMTGSDPETARFLNRDSFKFHYTHKLFIYTNHELVVKETGHGFWRRVRRVPFDYTVPEAEKDSKLEDKLRQEAEGVLVWLVEGVKAWVKEGLGVPEVVKEATRAYQESQDIFQQFVNDCCDTEAVLKVRTKVLQDAFKKWQEEEMNMQSYTAPAFNRMVTDHGYKYYRDKTGRYFVGLALKASVPLKPQPPQATNGHSNGHTAVSHVDLDVELEAIEGL